MLNYFHNMRVKLPHLTWSLIRALMIFLLSSANLLIYQTCRWAGYRTKHLSNSYPCLLKILTRRSSPPDTHPGGNKGLSASTSHRLIHRTGWLAVQLVPARCRRSPSVLGRTSTTDSRRAAGPTSRAPRCRSGEWSRSCSPGSRSPLRSPGLA